MTNVNQQTERDMLHDAFQEMIKFMFPDEIAHNMDALLYGYRLGKKDTLDHIQRDKKEPPPI